MARGGSAGVLLRWFSIGVAVRGTLAHVSGVPVSRSTLLGFRRSHARTRYRVGCLHGLSPLLWSRCASGAW